MSHPRAASGNAAATARLYLGRQSQVGDVINGGRHGAILVEAVAAPRPPNRLPSTRPLDRRWDKSRGIFFAGARRPTNSLWTPGDGIVFAAAPSNRKNYAMKSFNTPSTPKPPQAKTVQSRSVPPRPPPPNPSRSSNPAPGKLPDDTSDSRMEPLNISRADIYKKELATLRNEFNKMERLCQLLKANVRDLENNLDQTKAAAKGDRDTLSSIEASHNRAMKASQEKMERELQIAKATIKQLEGLPIEAAKLRKAAEETMREAKDREARAQEYIDAAVNLENGRLGAQYKNRRSTLEEEYIDRRKTLEEEDRNRRKTLEEQYKDQGSQQRTDYNNRCAEQESAYKAKVQALEQRKKQRTAYRDYRDHFLAYYDTCYRLSGHIDDLTRSYNGVLAFLKKGPSVTAEIKKINPWVSHNPRHMYTLERVDDHIRKHQEKVQIRLRDLANARKALWKKIEASRTLSHMSRRQTNVLHYSASLTDGLTIRFWYNNLNTLPLLRFRQGLDAEIERGGTRTGLHYQRLLRERRVVTDATMMHEELSFITSLKALLNHSLADKLIFAGSEQAEQHTTIASKLYRASSVGADAQPLSKEAREAFMKQQSTIRLAAEQYANLLRKRTLLKEILGKSTEADHEKANEIIKGVLASHQSGLRSVLARFSSTQARSEGASAAVVSISPRTIRRGRRAMASKLPSEKPAPHPLTDREMSLHRELSVHARKVTAMEAKAQLANDPAERQALLDEAVKHASLHENKKREQAELGLESALQRNDSNRVAHLRTKLRLMNATTGKGRARARPSSQSARSSAAQGTPRKATYRPSAVFRPSFSKQSEHTYWPSLSAFPDAEPEAASSTPHSAPTTSTEHAVSDTSFEPTSFLMEPPESVPANGQSVEIAVTPAEAEKNKVDATAIQDGLSYQIAPSDYRNAVLASPASQAAFWSHNLYKDAKGQKPTLYYCISFEKAEEQAQKFLDEPVVGFDIEWESGASVNKNRVKENVSLIQIAAEDKIALFQVALFKGDSIDELMPPSLRKILESDKVVKAGVNISGDATRMQKCLDVDMKGLFELSHLYRVVMFSEIAPSKVSRKLMSLAEQVRTILLLPLKKDEVRTSAWSKRLSFDQTAYAGADAYAGFCLYHALEAKRKRMKPVPPRPAFYEEFAPLILGDGTSIPFKGRTKPSKLTENIAVEEESEDEFFDAVETLEDAEVAGVPLAGLYVSYPVLPSLEQMSITKDNETPGTETTSVSKPKTSSRPSKASVPPSAELTQAEDWAATWRATLPPEYNLRATNSHLRAWHLWHEQEMDVPQVAACARDPPLAIGTVATYILEAVKHETLPYNAERLGEVLKQLPRNALGRYQKIIDQRERMLLEGAST